MGRERKGKGGKRMEGEGKGNGGLTYEGTEVKGGEGRGKRKRGSPRLLRFSPDLGVLE